MAPRSAGLPSFETEAGYANRSLWGRAVDRSIRRMADFLSLALPITGTFLLAGLTKGVLGLGLPTIAMGLLGLFMPPVEAAAMLVVPSLVTNLWQLLAGPRLAPVLHRLWPMMLGVAVGTLASSGVITGAEAGLTTGALGGALMLYGIVGLLKKARLRVPSASERWLAPLVGVTTGLVTGATGVLVMPAVPYLGSIGLKRDELVQALGLSFTVSTLALAAGLALHGALPLRATGVSLLALGPALAGMMIGASLRRRLSPAIFRALFFIGLLALGCELVRRGLT